VRPALLAWLAPPRPLPVRPALLAWLAPPRPLPVRPALLAWLAPPRPLPAAANMGAGCPRERPARYIRSRRAKAAPKGNASPCRPTLTAYRPEPGAAIMIL